MSYLDPPQVMESELSRLRFENESLAEELAQCQADKEFVWSLWKRLQIANPDITQAIGMVVQREKEKAEIKDHKVLGIIQAKDDKLEDLQRVLTTQSKELSAVLAKKVELQDEVAHLGEDNKHLQGELQVLKEQVAEYQSKETTTERIKKLEKEKEDAENQLKKKEEEIENLKKDKVDIRAIKDTLKDRVKVLEGDLKEMGQNFETLAKENHQQKTQLRKLEKELSVQQQDAGGKDKELEAVRKELSDLWQTHSQMTEHADQQADLIKQLQGLQQDTQKMLRNQEDAFSMETTSLQNMYTELTTRYQAQRAVEIDLRNEILQYKRTLCSQEEMIANLQRQLDESQNRSIATQASLSTDDKEVQALAPDAQIEYRLQSMQKEISSLKGKLKEKNRELEETIGRHDEEKDPLTDEPEHLRSSGVKKVRGRRSVSSSPVRSERKTTVLQRKLEAAQKKFEDTRALLKMKNDELEELQSAHSRRLERLKSLQHNYRLIKTQLKTLEEEVHGAPKKKKKLRRSDPKTLQKEDSDTVWNELAFFKNENRNLVVENMNQQEEVDTLKVQVAQDAATIHELRTCLEHEREELQFILEQQQQRSSTPTPDHMEELQTAKLQADKLETRVKSLLEENQQITKEKDSLFEERKALKTEVNELKQQIADKRMEVTDQKREVLRLQREMKRLRRKRNSGKTTLTKQYQKVLNRSINRMSQMFDQFDKDGWEEVSDSEDVTFTGEQTNSTEQTGTTESLGQAIVTCAQTQGEDPSIPLHQSTPSRPHRSPTRSQAKTAPTARQVESIEEHLRRMAMRNESPTRDRPVRSPRRDVMTGDTVGRHDVALSPIMIDRALSPINVLGHAGRPHVISTKKTLVPSSGGRQMNTYRQRILSLQKEVAILKLAKNASNKKEAEHRRTIEGLQSDLQNVNQKLQTARLTIQRLNSDIDRLKLEKEVLEHQVDTSSLDTSGSQQQQRTDQEWASLQARLKVTSGEVSKQLSQIKQLRAENVTQADKIHQLLDRINHLERDLSQKRALLDDVKLKLKISQENAQSDANIMIEAENKLKSLGELNSRYKTQLDSFKQRLTAVTKAKYDNEEKVIQLSEQLEKKSKLVSDLQKKTGELQSAMSELEKAAQQQMHALANQSKAALNVAQSKVTTANSHVLEFHKFVKILAHTILNSANQTKQMLQQQKQRQQMKQDDVPVIDDAAPSLKRAQQVACDILDLSQSEFEDLMSGKDEEETEEEESNTKSDDAKKDKKWLRKSEKLLKSKEFAISLVDLLMEKVDERTQLAAQLWAK